MVFLKWFLQIIFVDNYFLMFSFLSKTDPQGTFIRIVSATAVLEMDSSYFYGNFEMRLTSVGLFIKQN